MKNRRGSITVEAAIVMPVFICIVVSLAMLIKLVYIHEVIQHSIDETANELATYSYIYHISDLKQIDDAVQENIESESGRADQHIKTFIEAFDQLKETQSEIGNQQEDFSILESVHKTRDGQGNATGTALLLADDTGRMTEEGLKQIDELQKVLEDIGKNPIEEAKSFAWLMAEGIYGDAKTVVAVPMIKQILKKYLVNDKYQSADARLKTLNIAGGYQGLDFYSSSFFQGSEDIDIIVKYKVELPIPIKILPDIYIVQRSTSRAWLNGGDGITNDASDIWKLPPLERGRKIQQMYGRNMPFNFPVIAVYHEDTGLGTSVKSINLNSESYKDGDKLKKQLIQYVKELRDCSVLTYKDKNYQITSKKLILVVPKGSIHEGNKAVLDQILDYAQNSEVELTINEL